MQVKTRVKQLVKEFTMADLEKSKEQLRDFPIFEATGPSYFSPDDLTSFEFGLEVALRGVVDPRAQPPRERRQPTSSSTPTA